MVRRSRGKVLGRTPRPEGKVFMERYTSSGMMQVPIVFRANTHLIAAR